MRPAECHEAGWVDSSPCGHLAPLQPPAPALLCRGAKGRSASFGPWEVVAEFCTVRQSWAHKPSMGTTSRSRSHMSIPGTRAVSSFFHGCPCRSLFTKPQQAKNVRCFPTTSFWFCRVFKLMGHPPAVQTQGALVLATAAGELTLEDLNGLLQPLLVVVQPDDVGDT